VTAKFDQDPDPHWFKSLAPDPDGIRTEVKRWIQIRNNDYFQLRIFTSWKITFCRSGIACQINVVNPDTDP
jgi:hypothetical protein